MQCLLITSKKKGSDSIFSLVEGGSDFSFALTLQKHKSRRGILNDAGESS